MENNIFDYYILVAIDHSMQMKRRNTLSDVMPTIKKACTQEQKYSYSHGKTYQKNGLILKHKLTNLKIKQLVQVFARKLKRNLTSAQPVEFQIRSPKQNERLVQWKGWDIQENIQRFILFLDIVMSLIVLFLSTCEAFLDDFHNVDSGATVVILKFISLVVFSVRLIFAMVTVDFEDDVLYLYIVDIMKKQFKDGSIILHIFSLVMVLLSLTFDQYAAIMVICFFSSLLKLFLIRSNLKILELRFVDSMKKFYLWNIARLVIFNIVFAHMMAAALLAAAKLNPEKNWITVKLVNNNLVGEEQTWHVVYFWSYYWSCTIIMTVGFGDISPIDYRESIVVSAIEITSSIILAYNFSEVGSIISSIRKSSQTLQRKLGVLRRMTKEDPIPQELQCKIESYLTHQIEIRDTFEYGEHREIIDHLPQQLKHQYFFQSNKQLYESVPVLRHFQRECLAKLNHHFEGKVFYPGQYIIKYRAGCNKVIIMKSGQFGLAYWKPQSKLNGTVIQSINLQKKSGIGLLVTTNILTRDYHLNYDIVSQQYSFGIQMDMEIFLRVLKQSSIDYYFYRSIVDKHEKLPNSYEYVRCEHCRQQFHTKFECTRLHYIPTKSEVFFRNRNPKSISTERKQCIHKIKKLFRHSYHSRKNFFMPLEQALKIYPQLQAQEEELNVDSPHDFFMYFKQSNPQMLEKKQMKVPKMNRLLEMVDKLNKKDNIQISIEDAS